MGNAMMPRHEGVGMDYTSHYESPLGGITLASDGRALVGLWFDGQKHFAEGLAEDNEPADLPIFDDVRLWLDSYFQGRDPGFTPALTIRATTFRREVGEIMLSIPFGQTMTYGEIAREVARRRGLQRMSSRAVGGAVGHNALSLIVPCHRVVGSNGSLTGYAGGLERKLALLELEGVDFTRLHVPGRASRSDG